MAPNMTHTHTTEPHAPADWRAPQPMTGTPRASVPGFVRLVAERVLPGLPAAVNEARCWVQAMLSAAVGHPYVVIDDACLLVVSELATNTLLHSLSGDDGGEFVVLVEAVATSLAYEITIHLHDAGPTGRPGSRFRPDGDGSGMGLVVVVQLVDSYVRDERFACPADCHKDDPTARGTCARVRFLIPLPDAPEATDADA
jgi:serine/threonine-protein kinase RsbW